MITTMITSSWNLADVKALGANVDVRTFQTAIANVVRRSITRITSVAGIQS